MHAGFQPLRQACPMDILARAPVADLEAPVEANVRRILSLWRDCRTRYGGDGPFLFGRFTVADAMYAPVASRMRTYLPELAQFGDDGTGADYVETIFAMPEMKAWIAGAEAQSPTAG
jgi:glutathione S-transferase